MPTFVNAKETCNFFIEYDPDVTFEDKNKPTGDYEFGKLKHKKKSILDLFKGLKNDYACQYFSSRRLKKNSKRNRELIPSNIRKKDREA